MDLVSKWRCRMVRDVGDGVDGGFGVYPARMVSSDVILVSVGNTRTRLALVQGGALQPSQVLVNASPDELVGRIRDICGGRTDVPVLIASVNDPVAEPLADAIRAQGRRVMRASATGAGLHIPIRHDLVPPVKVGVDRLLAALGAYSRSGQACVVVDAGTAVTVDFVDATGKFLGGCIAPGLALMLGALHEHTAALPLVTVRDGEPFDTGPGPLGKTTTHAMTLGCIAAIQGMTHVLIDRYAEMNGSYPRVVATGGDAPRIFENDDLVEHIVPDLVLMGMHATYEAGAPAEAE